MSGAFTPRQGLSYSRFWVLQALGRLPYTSAIPQTSKHFPQVCISSTGSSLRFLGVVYRQQEYEGANMLECSFQNVACEASLHYDRISSLQ